MPRFTAFLPAIVAALGLPAAAASVSHGFNVTVDLNGASGVKLDARPQPMAVAAGPRSVTVANALVLRRFHARALRLRLE
ncbi:MAG TPA: hypothetical protein VFO24_02945, partial [Usitatibacter sp.]|nr:hypothetical protein [Usitatibacter sp.]